MSTIFERVSCKSWEVAEFFDQKSLCVKLLCCYLFLNDDDDDDDDDDDHDEKLFEVTLSR